MVHKLISVSTFCNHSSVEPDTLKEFCVPCDFIAKKNSKILADQTWRTREILAVRKAIWAFSLDCAFRKLIGWQTPDHVVYELKEQSEEQTR